MSQAAGREPLRCGTVPITDRQPGRAREAKCRRWGIVPLSEEEQRILHEIERRFYANDPERAKRISSETLPRYLARNCRWSALGILVGIVIVVVSLATSLVLGVFGLALLLASAIVFTQNLRRMGRHGLTQLSESVRARNNSGAWEDARQRFRRRFGGD
jgi:hypothetical protein